MENNSYGLDPNKLFYTLSEVKVIGLMSIEQMKLKLYTGVIKGIKNGRNWRIPRDELLRYINEEMTIRTDEKH